MSRRPITAAEIEAARHRRGGWDARQFRLWGLPSPPRKGWRARLLRLGVPASCPYPEGFAGPRPAEFEPATNPLLAFARRDAAAPMPADAVEIFTDGSCEPNPGSGGWGFAVYRGREEIHSASGREAPTTNNRMELSAMIGALAWLDPRRPAIVWSDSQYVVRGCIDWRHGWRRESWTRGGKARANADLWQALEALLGERIVDIRWTRGHAGTVGNERADALAGGVTPRRGQR